MKTFGLLLAGVLLGGLTYLAAGNAYPDGKTVSVGVGTLPAEVWQWVMAAIASSLPVVLAKAPAWSKPVLVSVANGILKYYGETPPAPGPTPEPEPISILDRIGSLIRELILNRATDNQIDQAVKLAKACNCEDDE